MNIPARREALDSVIRAIDEVLEERLRAAEDAEVLEQQVRAVEDRWARLVSDAVCGVRRGL